MEHGIVIGGEVLPGTEFVRREKGAWWDPASRQPDGSGKWKGGMALDRYQLRKREGDLDILCGHWTAGEAGTYDPDRSGPMTEFDDDGPRVVSIMKGRASRKNPGRRLKVSVQFVIGACAPDAEVAPVWQTMDLGLGWAATHVGRGEVNCRSIGVEVVNAGIDGQTNVRRRPETIVQQFGRPAEVLKFYPGQLRAWVMLANALSDGRLPGDINIPRQVPVNRRVLEGKDLILPHEHRFTRKQLQGWKGAMEHYLMDNTTKRDAGTLLLQALLDDGWEGVVF